MELRINIDYTQILALIQQLPKRDIERLAITLQSEISTKKTTKSLKELILKAPTWSDSDFKDYQEVRNFINLKIIK
jgi:hypothetical protein